MCTATLSQALIVTTSFNFQIVSVQMTRKRYLSVTTAHTQSKYDIHWNCPYRLFSLFAGLQIFWRDAAYNRRSWHHFIPSRRLNRQQRKSRSLRQPQQLPYHCIQSGLIKNDMCAFKLFVVFAEWQVHRRLWEHNKTSPMLRHHRSQLGLCGYRV